MQTVLVFLTVLAAIVLLVRSAWRRAKRKGCGCSGCPGGTGCASCSQHKP